MSVPAGIAGSVQNDFLPFGHHAGHYARSIPGALLTQLEEGRGHFISLDTCHDNRDSGEGLSAATGPEPTLPGSMPISDRSRQVFSTGISG
jgi:hypothetical protein